ncbi:TetR/AcrR family transcriptional regulator C-terminal domain-containing protein [Nocardia gamkensis]|uniref:TetR/AcrR family transcriptional regulator C-terminal domain-containing protein n=1 Tax=Nocardia TaxID=1817 RepID=UPI00340D7DD4
MCLYLSDHVPPLRAADRVAGGQATEQRPGTGGFPEGPGREDAGFYRLVVAETPRFPQPAAIYRRAMERFGAPLAYYLRDQSARGVLAVPDVDAAARQFGMFAYGEVSPSSRAGSPRRRIAPRPR